MISEDDRSITEEARTAAQKLLQRDQVVALLGEVASSRSLAAAPEAQRAKIPMISPASTNPKVTEVGDYVFRTCFIDPFQGAVMARFAKDELGAKRVAILFDFKQDYSVGLADFFRKTFLEQGGEIVADERYTSGDIEFRAQLTTIRAANPDAVFVPGYYTELGLIAKQARELGLERAAPRRRRLGLGEDARDRRQGGRGLLLLEPLRGGLGRARRSRPSSQRYKAKHGEVPDAMAALGYDMTGHPRRRDHARRRRPRRAKLRDAIAATKDYDGVTGKITIDAQRERPEGRRRAEDRGRQVPVLPLGAGLLEPPRLENFLQQLLNGVTWGGIYALIALGYTMVYGVLKLINFAHGDVYMVGAMTGYFFAHVAGFAGEPSILGLALTILVAMARLRRARRADRARRLPAAAAARRRPPRAAHHGDRRVAAPRERRPARLRRRPEVLPVAHRVARARPGRAASRSRTSRRSCSPPRSSLMAVLEFVVMRTRFGRAMRAVSYDAPAAALMGVPVDRVVLGTFVLGSALAAAAGILVGLSNPKIDPLMGIMPGIKAFVAAVLGGIGNIPGAMVGGFVLGVVETLVSGYLSSTYRDAIAFVVLIVILLFKPTGLFGVPQQEKV